VNILFLMLLFLIFCTFLVFDVNAQSKDTLELKIDSAQ